MQLPEETILALIILKLRSSLTNVYSARESYTQLCVYLKLVRIFKLANTKCWRFFFFFFLIFCTLQGFSRGVVNSTLSVLIKLQAGHAPCLKKKKKKRTPSAACSSNCQNGSFPEPEWAGLQGIHLRTVHVPLTVGFARSRPL